MLEEESIKLHVTDFPIFLPLLPTHTHELTYTFRKTRTTENKYNKYSFDLLTMTRNIVVVF